MAHPVDSVVAPMPDRFQKPNARLPKSLIVLDVETTGLLPGQDAILELAGCLLSDTDLEEKSFFQSRVYTNKVITEGAHKTHGLTLDDVENAPALPEVVAAFAGFAPPGAILCGHNVSFDVGFLQAAYSTAGRVYPFDYHALDVWSLAFFVLGARGVQLPSYSLTSLCSVFGIAREPHHGALQDARASAAILRHLVAVIQGEGLDALGQFSLTGLKT